jgi:DNA-binding transcriptional LysR family regulator
MLGVAMRLTHRQIDVFRAVMHSGQATRAAALLHTSQPTISRELARLEQVLGMALFDRVAGRLQPTARALALLQEVERSYIGLDRIAATAQGLRDFAQGRLAVACLPALAHALLPDAVRRFCTQWPQAGVALTPQDSPLLEAWLSEQRFDLGLTELAQAPPGTTATRLLHVDEVAVLPQGHALLDRRRLRLKDFEGQPFISFAPADPYRQQVDALFAAAGVQRRLHVEAGSAAAACALVRQGLGLAIVNPLTAWDWRGQGLHVRPLAFSVPFEVSVVVPQLRVENPLRGAFLQALHAAARDLGALLKRPPQA